MRTVRWCAVAVLLVTVAACASERGDAGGGPASAPASDPGLSVVSARIEEFLRSGYPDSYAGMWVDAANNSLVVYRVQDRALDDAVRARWSTPAIEFLDARWTAGQMASLTDKVMADAAYWKRRAVTVNGAGPSYDGSAVEVMISEDPGAWQAAFDDRYGARAVRLVNGSATPVPGQMYRPSGVPYPSGAGQPS